jgi:hypothetical protein
MTCYPNFSKNILVENQETAAKSHRISGDPSPKKRLRMTVLQLEFIYA